MIFIFYGCIVLNIVFSAYGRFYPDEKHDKIKELHIAILDLKKQYADLDFQLEPYAVDCGLGRSKISYITNDKVSELLPKQGYIKKYRYYIVRYQNKWYLNIEEDTYTNKIYPFIDFYLYNKFGKSFSGYLKMVSFYLMCVGMLFVTYKPYIDYNTRSRD